MQRAKMCRCLFCPFSWLYIYIVLTGLSRILFLENYSMMTATLYNHSSRQCQEMAWTHNLIAFQVKDNSVYKNLFFFFVLRTMTHLKTGCRIWYCFKWGIKHPCLGRVQSLYLLFLHWLILSCNKFQLKPFHKAHCEQFKLQHLPTDECQCQN